MRNLTIVAILIILFSAACKKDNVKETNTLTGKWRTAGNMVSAGGPMYYVAPQNKDIYVQFNTDNTLGGDAFPGFSSFKIKDSVTVTFTKPDKTTYQNYNFSFRHDTLFISPREPIMCIEGCAALFVR